MTASESICYTPDGGEVRFVWKDGTEPRRLRVNGPGGRGTAEITDEEAVALAVLLLQDVLPSVDWLLIREAIRATGWAQERDREDELAAQAEARR